ncbi:MAG: hypothetical protein HQ536_01245 [Parcubacteria group bacterium]|nr:hypothetical protein [Parcubacteria group bacterium]
MEEKVKALSQKKNDKKQSPDEEDKPMTKKTGKTTTENSTGTRKVLTPEQVATIIEQWDNKSMTEFANEFNISLQVVSNMVKEIHKQDDTLCPPRTKRADIAKSGIALYKKKQK